ncbi:O-methyltransferase [Mycena floridula]|nr:O-methyltransferase [Mycena floridula]
MTFAILKALHAIIGDAIDDIESIYSDSGDQASASSVPSSPTSATAQNPPFFSSTGGYASPPPSPSVSSYLQSSSRSFSRVDTPPLAMPLDFPALDHPYDPNSPSELLTTHPTVIGAINRIVAAAGQLSATVQTPFLSLCDASMSYHLPACLRLLEASHTVEILRHAGSSGIHVNLIAEKNNVDKNKLAHILRLLATHHIIREVSPNVFANNRLSSMIDTGKSFEELKKNPEEKYRDTNGISAFVGMCTDELQKSSAYLTEAYLLSPSATKTGREPTRAPFNYAFGCEGVGFFGWLEGEGIDGRQVNGPGREPGMIPGLKPQHEAPAPSKLRKLPPEHGTPKSAIDPALNPNRFRLERFGKAMSGTEGWETPGAVLHGFDWLSLPRGSIVVDVGGGIGSTSMLLASAFSLEGSADQDCLGLKFIIQDRGVVVDMGEKAWKAKCPELLESGIAKFQVHDFFTPQPIKNAAVFLLRVILHDWPDAYAQRILLRLREAATEDTKLLLADFVLPLACVDDFVVNEGSDDAVDNNFKDVQRVEDTLAPAPLLANLGRASTHVYWMDLTMQVIFNGQERTLREVVELCHSTGWKVTRLVKAPGSLFGHITAVPAPIPVHRRARAGSGSALLHAGKLERSDGLIDGEEVVERSSSRCGTPTFGSSTRLPTYDETKARFGGGFMRGLGKRVTGVGSALKPSMFKPPTISNPALPKKKRPSPLSVPQPTSPSPVPRSPLPHKKSQGNLLRLTPSATAGSSKQAPASPGPSSPRLRGLSLGRRTSFAHLTSGNSPSPAPSMPTLQKQYSEATPVQPLTPSSPVASRIPLSRRGSMAHLRQPSFSGGLLPPPPIPSRIVSNQSRESLISVSSSDMVSPRPHSHSLSAPVPLVSRVPVPSSPQISRHKSHVQLSPKSLSRKRSESLVGLPSTLGVRRALPFGGSKLNFENVQDVSTLDVPDYPAPGGTILAAPAKIK